LTPRAARCASFSGLRARATNSLGGNSFKRPSSTRPPSFPDAAVTAIIFISPSVLRLSELVRSPARDLAIASLEFGGLASLRSYEAAEELVEADARNPKQAGIGVRHYKDEKDCACDRHRSDRGHEERRGVDPCEKAVTEEQGARPSHHDIQEKVGRRVREAADD